MLQLNWGQNLHDTQILYIRKYEIENLIQLYIEDERVYNILRFQAVLLVVLVVFGAGNNNFPCVCHVIPIFGKAV